LLRDAPLEDAAVLVPTRELTARTRVALGDSPEAILAAAHAEAQAILAEAEAQRAAGYEAGFAEGVEQARAAAFAEVETAIGFLRGAVAGLEHRIGELEVEAAPAAAALAIEIAARVLRAEVSARPERVVDVVRGAMRRAMDRERLVVRVNPADLAICREAVPDLLSTTGGIGRLDFFDDQRVTRGSCILETNAGDVDATFESQLERIHEALFAPPEDGLVDGPRH
jgi:flagellar biosynthesis/type III secretory pathway protein FliH